MEKTVQRRHIRGRLEERSIHGQSEAGHLITRSDGPEEILLLNILKCVGGLIH